MAEAKSLFVVLSANAAQYHAALAAAGRDTDRFGDKVEGMGTRLDGADGSINQLTGRLGLLARGALVATPAIAGLAAASVPLLMTLANLAGVSALAAGSTIVAFQGIADGYTALQKFQDDPTAENLQAVHDQFEKLSPAARELITTVDELAPALASVRDAGMTGLMTGGLDQTLDNVEDLIPGLRRFVREYTTIVGEITASSTEALTTDRWAEFGSFLKGEARGTLKGLASMAGDVAHGLSEMWMAFDPVNDLILSSLQRGAGTFDQWASDLEGNPKFEEFLDYVNENGPLAVDTAGEVADSVLQIGEAASPLTSGVLGGLEGFFSLLSDVADSDAGSFLFTLAAGLTAASLAQRGWVAIQGTSMAASIRGQSAAVRGLYGDLRLLASGYRDASAAQRVMTTQLLAQRTGSALRSAAPKVAAGAGVLAISSGVTDELGLANTATLALTGAMIGGPYGAIAGGLVGAFMDVKAASKGIDDRIDSLRDSMETTASGAGTFATELTGANDDLAALNAQIADLRDMGGDGADDLLGDIVGRGMAVFGRTDEDVEKLTAQINESSFAAFDLVNNLRLIQEAAGGGDPEAFAWFEDIGTGDIGTALVDNLAQVDAVIRSIAPAMSELGYSFEDLQSADFEFSGKAAEVAAMVAHLDSASGKAEALTASIMGLDNGLLSTAESAGIFSSALDAALDPQMNVVAQGDAWITSLRELNGELSKNSNTLNGNSNAAIENRAAILDRVTQLKATLTSQAEAGASAKQLGQSLRQQVGALVRFGTQAGLNERQLRGFLRTLGLTPKLVRTTMRLVGADKANAEVKALRTQFARIPKAVRAVIKAEGIPKTKAEARELADRLHLVGQPRRALIKLVADAAKAGIKNVNELLDDTDRNNPNPKITVNNSQATSALSTVQNMLNSINSKTITITTIRRERTERAFGGIEEGGRSEAGGYIPRASTIAAGGRDILWGERTTGWEAYISGDPGQRHRNKAIWMDTGRRLGYDLRDRAPRGRAHVSAGGGGAVVVQAPSGPMTIVGTLDTPWGPSEVRGVARQEARAEIQADRRWRRQQGVS